jgi:ankyrin repeat protein
MFIPTDDSRAVAVTAAIQAGDVDALKALIDKHPELITASIGSAKEARSLLHILTDYPGHFPNNVETAKALTASGADVNATFIGEQHSETPLHFAASCDDVEVLDALLDSGADINAGGGCIVETPLSVARAFLQLKCAHRLVERGAKVTVNDAATLGLLDRVKEFYTAKEKPTKESTSLTFWNACHGGQLEIAQYLFSQGCDVNVIPPWQPQTPLDAANVVKAEDLVKWLESVGGRSAKKDE